jgi:hypothetical protein
LGFIIPLLLFGPPENWVHPGTDPVNPEAGTTGFSKEKFATGMSTVAACAESRQPENLNEKLRFSIYSPN